MEKTFQEVLREFPNRFDYFDYSDAEYPREDLDDVTPEHFKQRKAARKKDEEENLSRDDAGEPRQL